MPQSRLVRPITPLCTTLLQRLQQVLLQRPQLRLVLRVPPPRLHRPIWVRQMPECKAIPQREV